MDLKEKILGKHTGETGIYLTHGMVRGSEALEAMDELSKIVAIAFAKWVPENAYIAEDEYFYELLMNGTRISEQDLFELFTQSKEYKELMDQK